MAPDQIVEEPRRSTSVALGLCFMHVHGEMLRLALNPPLTGSSGSGRIQKPFSHQNLFQTTSAKICVICPFMSPNAPSGAFQYGSPVEPASRR